jgi:hypothetical protein
VVQLRAQGESGEPNDLAITKIAAPKKVTLSEKVPARALQVKIAIQNPSAHTETISDAADGAGHENYRLSAHHPATTGSHPRARAGA